MKKIIFCAFILLSTVTLAQDNGYFYGGLESNSQWLQPDEGIDFPASNEFEDGQFRANNYLQLNYSLGNFTAGLQYESYLPSALLGYAPIYDGGNGIATYYINYKNDNLDITGGYFYEQFGSGLIFRSWEDRQLGINNALRGLRFKFDVTEYFDLTGIYGQQRNGFELSEGTIQGVDANLDVSDALKIEEVDIRLGVSYVSRFQDRGQNDTIPKNVNAVGGRLDLVFGNFYGGVEAIAKSKDAIVNEERLVSNKLYDGTALQVNMGYAQKGLGINGTFRRLENFSFYSDRFAEGNTFNQQILNYVPALTKQQDYLLTNIYVYNAQPRLIIDSSDQRSGEVGTQLDVFYSLDKGSPLGGKYGTKIAVNFSYWGGLDAEYNVPNKFYKAKFIGKGPRLYRDWSAEIKKRWTSKFSSVITFQDIIIDKGVTSGPIGTQGDITAQIGVIEGTYRLEKGASIRAVAQHLWSKKDRGNWAAAVIEYNFNSRLAIYAADSYNYGGEGKIHYYNFGGSYSKGRTRVGMNYGRQRGGLICVGGVCRFVPENTGLSANIVVSF
ncbi:DUF6029 family protein [Cochleicola gelatinilyticus]|uniref:Uncharacterized protein n=1 Tax=Cochleicola gelatinilyticus TaxID=1763537 RepID=A0A167F2M5_9FLAO|nr:DUF6029 family protein [Cochleicola gelatinilyticus]OAB76126.1 hypothetical protein ULVI_13805 [Cochleicola gelatinilyticus]